MGMTCLNLVIQYLLLPPGLGLRHVDQQSCSDRALQSPTNPEESRLRPVYRMSLAPAAQLTGPPEWQNVLKHRFMAQQAQDEVYKDLIANCEYRADSVSLRYRILHAARYDYTRQWRSP